MIDLDALVRFKLLKTEYQLCRHGRFHRQTRCASVPKEILAQGANRSHSSFDVSLDVGGDNINRDVNHTLGRDRAELAALAASAADFDHSHRGGAANRRNLVFMRAS